MGMRATMGSLKNLYDIYKMAGPTMWERQQWDDFRRKSETQIKIKTKRHPNIRKRFLRLDSTRSTCKRKVTMKLLEGRKEGKVIASQGNRKMEERGDDDVVE